MPQPSPVADLVRPASRAAAPACPVTLAADLEPTSVSLPTPSRRGCPMGEVVVEGGYPQAGGVLHEEESYNKSPPLPVILPDVWNM
ncbi:hypothetical protein HaLaN_14959 [Haematococcus lacustris]|uniref:Uncharacterized protein n=1 Tax=Haematococcus lacustris TaxID=44745 RepID=A0A699ZFP3_HAELA|nr:hypothetical protein HaLaN_14959 [Haematococcus lacustris]